MMMTGEKPASYVNATKEARNVELTGPQAFSKSQRAQTLASPSSPILYPKSVLT